MSGFRTMTESKRKPAVLWVPWGHFTLKHKRCLRHRQLVCTFQSQKVHFDMTTVSYFLAPELSDFFFFFAPANGLGRNTPCHWKVKVLLLTPRNSSVTGEDCTSCLNLLGRLKSNNCDRQIVGSLPRLSALISNGICQTSCLAAKGSRKLN